jgi:ribonuclease Z
MLEVIFLGTSSAIPGRGGSNAAYFVRLGSENLLIDCGPSILQQLDAVGISPREISHMFFTHKHGDHALGFPMLMLWYALNPSQSIQTPVLIGSGQTLEALEQMMLIAYGPDLIEIVNSAPKITLPQDAPGEARIHPHIMLKTLPMDHNDFAPVLGARIETRGERLGEHVLAFTGDTGPCDNIAVLARGADLLVHEANLCATLDPQWAAGAFGHSTAQIAGRNAALARVKRLALTHIGAQYQDNIDTLLAEARAEFDGDVSAPTSGLVYTIV